MESKLPPKKREIKLPDGLRFKQYAEAQSVAEGNGVIDVTDHGTFRNQIIPSVYFRPNDFFRTEFTTVEHGMMITLISHVNNITINLEANEEIMERRYKIDKGVFFTMLDVQRGDILSFERGQEIDFMGVNPSKTNEIVSRIPVGGLIPMLVTSGVASLTRRAENKLAERKGVLFYLHFKEGHEAKTLELIVESFYANTFQSFLTRNWKENMPEMDAAPQQGEGCFVATACYGDYDHPVVVDLRMFRDNTLAKSALGRIFIKLYYFFGPYLAAIIEKNNTLRRFSLKYLVAPIHQWLISNR